MKRFGSMQEVASRKTKNVFLVGFAFAAALSASSGASAQGVLPANCTGTLTTSLGIGTISSQAGAVASTVAGVIGNINTAFLTQQGSAFVSAPANPAPNQEGGGVWTRALGGTVNINSTTTTSGAVTGGTFGGAINSNCNTRLHQDFAGIQVGADIAKLNWNGWNFHLGTTAGYLGSNAKDNNGLRTGIEVPFFGTYLVATYGRFFADVLVRQDFYNLNVDNTDFGLANQPVGAHGLSISTSAGYNFALQNNWFIEPSAGFTWSSTKIDSINTALPVPAGFTLGGTTSFNDVDSKIGRLSVRVGTTISTPKVVYQPFFSASVFHEFAGTVNSAYGFCPTCVVDGSGNPLQFGQTSSTTRVGTYGQYSIGLAAQIVNTGWLGFVRADYRNGDKIDGYTGNAGLRYQFTPEAVASVMHTKAPMMNAYGTTNWTGFYVGGFAGGAYGRTDIRFPDAASTTSKPYVFGPLGGIQMGYNTQINNWVLGVEGDIGVASLRGGRTCGSDDGNFNPAGFDPFYQTCNDRMNWMGTVAARLGYATGRTLWYVKAGGAAADGRVTVRCVDTTIDCANPNGTVYPQLNPDLTNQTQAHRNRYGWTVGYGSEFDLGKGWSAKAEYDYIDFGRNSQLASDGETVLSVRSTVSQVKLGVNYRFGAAPVTARY